MKLKETGFYILSAAICFAAFYVLADMRHADPSVPLYYNLEKDYTAHQTFFWNFAETGSATIAPRLGAPDISDSRRFPINSVDRFEWLLVGALKYISTDFAFLLNTYYILTYIFSCLTAAFVFRLVGLSRPAALAGGLLFAFQPYHWFQSVGHLFISSYYMVPLLSLITLWITFQDDSHFICWKPGTRTRNPEKPVWKQELFNVRFSPVQCRAAIAFVTIVIASSTGSMYYLLMSVILWFFVGVHSIAIRPAMNRVYDLVSLIGFSLFACIMQLIPTFLYTIQNHIPPLKRSADVTGFDLFWAFFPSIGHRSMLFRKFVTMGRFYNHPEDQIFYALTEKSFTALGVIGAAGLTLILLSAWIRRPETGRLKLLKNIPTITIIGIFISTTNGINRIFAYLPSFPIRAWNRFSIILAFYSLLVLVSLYEELQDRLKSNGKILLSRLAIGFLGIVTLFGLWDQSPSIWIPEHETASKRWHEDKEFVENLESSLPAQAMIFNLPVSHYPEGIGNQKSHLTSKRLHWSFGAYREGEYLSDSAKWQLDLVEQTGPEIIAGLQKKGFSGILIEDDPHKKLILNSDYKTRQDLYDLDLRYRVLQIEKLDVIEAKIKDAGLKPAMINHRGDWRYYAITPDPDSKTN